MKERSDDRIKRGMLSLYNMKYLIKKIGVI